MRNAVIPLFLFLSTLLAAQEAGGFSFADGTIGKPGDSFYSQTLAIRFRSLAKVLFPRTGFALGPEILCAFSVQRVGFPDAFRAENRSGGKRIEIFLPAVFAQWSEDPRKLNALARWTLLSRLGIPLKAQSRIPDSWLEAGFARKAASDSWRMRNARFGKYPAAYAFASHGIFPELRDVVGVTPHPGDGFSRLVYEEWAQILLELCLRSGAARNGLLERYQNLRTRDPETDRFQLFLDVFSKHLEKYGSRKYGRFVQTNGEFDIDKWFRREAERALVSRFLPMSLDFLEESYRQAVRLNGKKGIRTIADFAGKWRGKPDVDLSLQLSESLIRLTELLYSAPSEVTVSLSALINEISALRDFGADDASGKRLNSAEKRFFQALEKQSLTENILKEAERKYVPVGARYTLTFSEREWAEKITDPAREVLDNYVKRMDRINAGQGSGTEQ